MKFHQHPLNTEISNYVAWLFDKCDERKMTDDQREAVVRAGNVVFAQSGLPKGPNVDDVTLAVFRQKLHVMKKVTAELCPNLADEVRNWSSGLER